MASVTADRWWREGQHVQYTVRVLSMLVGTPVIMYAKSTEKLVGWINYGVPLQTFRSSVPIRLIAVIVGYVNLGSCPMAIYPRCEQRRDIDITWCMSKVFAETNILHIDSWWVVSCFQLVSLLFETHSLNMLSHQIAYSFFPSPFKNSSFQTCLSLLSFLSLRCIQSFVDEFCTAPWPWVCPTPLLGAPLSSIVFEDIGST